MANIGVKGRITDETGLGISGLTVCAFDIDPITADDHLGTVQTDGNGGFHITYTTDKYRLWWADRNPDIEVRIFGPGQRLLWETPIAEGVSQDTLQLDPIKIHKHNFPVGPGASDAEKKDARSWLVTHTSLDPENGEPIRLTQGNQVEWLPDGAEMFPAVTEAIETATKSIKFMNMFFKIGKLFTKFDFEPGQNPTNIQEGDEVKVSRLEKILKKKAGDENIPVHVLVWDLLDVDLLDFVDTADEVRDFFQGSQVLTDVLETTQLMHSKLAIIDGDCAFVIGSTMSQGYFSDERHLIRDVRHGGSLIHDVSAKVKGPAVRDVDQTFSTVWDAQLTVSPVKSAPRPAPLQNGAALQILRTLPGELFGNLSPDDDTEDIPHGETGILEAYQRAIMNAEEYIYVEDQYFTSPEIINAIKQRMEEVPSLEVILVLNIKPDIAGYPQKQAALINELRTVLGDQKNRLGVYSLWRSDAGQNPFEIKNIYVHSKLAIIDDKWVTVGSANLDGASLNQRQWGLILKGTWEDLPLWKKLLTPLVPFIILLTSPLTFPLFLPFIVSSIKKETARPSQHVNPHRSRQPARHPELNIVMYNDIAGQLPTGKVAELRQRLWAEHFGAPPPATKPAAGWLSLWNDAAASYLQSIRNAAESKPFNQPIAKILEWKPPTNQKKNLEALGIKTRNIRVRDRAAEIKFIPKE